MSDPFGEAALEAIIGSKSGGPLGADGEDMDFDEGFVDLGGIIQDLSGDFVEQGNGVEPVPPKFMGAVERLSPRVAWEGAVSSAPFADAFTWDTGKGPVPPAGIRPTLPCSDLGSCSSFSWPLLRFEHKIRSTPV